MSARGDREFQILSSGTASDRKDALDRLRARVKQDGLPKSLDINKLFGCLNKCLVDESWSVSHQCLLLLGELAHHLQSDRRLSRHVDGLLPHIVMSLGSRKGTTRKAALNTVLLLMKYSFSAQHILNALAQSGFSHREPRVRMNSIIAVPDLVQAVPHRIELKQVLSSLITHLDDSQESVAEAVKATLKTLYNTQKSVPQLVLRLGYSHQQALKRHMPDLLQNHNAQQHQQQVNSRSSLDISQIPYFSEVPSQFHQTPRRSADLGEFKSHSRSPGREHSISSACERDVQSSRLKFGFVPTDVIEQLQANQESKMYRARITASAQILNLMREKDDLVRTIGSEVGNLLEFLIFVVKDRHFKVVMNGLTMMNTFFQALGPLTQRYLQRVLPVLVQKFAETKLVIRVEMKLFKTLLLNCGAGVVTGSLLTHLADDNWQVRMQVVHVIILALLCCQNDRTMSFHDIACTVALVVEDPTRKVQLWAKECLAILADLLGRQRLLGLLRDRITSEGYEMVITRLDDPRLPTLHDADVVFPSGSSGVDSSFPSRVPSRAPSRGETPYGSRAPTRGGDRSSWVGKGRLSHLPNSNIGGFIGGNSRPSSRSPPPLAVDPRFDLNQKFTFPGSDISVLGAMSPTAHMAIPEDVESPTEWNYPTGWQSQAPSPKNSDLYCNANSEFKGGRTAPASLRGGETGFTFERKSIRDLTDGNSRTSMPQSAPVTGREIDIQDSMMMEKMRSKIAGLKNKMKRRGSSARRARLDANSRGLDTGGLLSSTAPIARGSASSREGSTLMLNNFRSGSPQDNNNNSLAKTAEHLPLSHSSSSSTREAAVRSSCNDDIQNTLSRQATPDLDWSEGGGSFRGRLIKLKKRTSRRHLTSPNHLRGPPSRSHPSSPMTNPSSPISSDASEATSATAPHIGRTASSSSTEVLTPPRRPSRAKAAARPTPGRQAGTEWGNVEAIAHKVGAEYASEEELRPLDDPSGDMKRAIRGIKSGDWSTRFKAMNNMRRMAMHHADTLRPHTKRVCGLLKTNLESLRSIELKNAILTIVDFTRFLRKDMDVCVDALLPLLLKKATESNQFIRKEALLSLDSMVKNLTKTKFLTSLLTAFHGGKGAKAIRQPCAEYIKNTIAAMGSRIATYRNLERVLKTMGIILSEGSLSTRQVGKRMVFQLAKALGEQELVAQCGRIVSSSEFLSLQKVLEKGEAELEMSSLTSFSRRDSVVNRTPSSRPGSKLKQRYGRTPGRTTRANSRTNSRMMASRESKVMESARDLSRGGVYSAKKKTRVAGGAKGSSSMSSQNSAADDDSLGEIFSNIDGKDWRTKVQGIEALGELVSSNSSLVARHASRIVDRLNKRLDDGNAKVNIVALKTLGSLAAQIKSMSSSESQIRAQLISSVASRIGASNVTVRKMASNVLETFINTLEVSSLVKPLSSATLFGKLSTRPAMLSKILPLIERASTAQIRKHIIPLSLTLLKAKSNSPEVRDGNIRVIRSVYSILGDKLYDATAVKRLSHDQLQKLRDITG